MPPVRLQVPGREETKRRKESKGKNMVVKKQMQQVIESCKRKFAKATLLKKEGKTAELTLIKKELAPCRKIKRMRRGPKMCELVGVQVWRFLVSRRMYHWSI